ncbi:MAG TPA: ATP phosphoribosyltransferase regulatory subunit [Caldilineaceae bacterium]|nr:ATP phosphoribosyltransferase regulatory subunit [Caldilineaceae bacterium]
MMGIAHHKAMTTQTAPSRLLPPDATRQAHIPTGVADYFWREALDRRELEARLLQLFRTWGYEDVIPPMFEYADTYRGRASEKLQAEMYRFLDRDGSTLALRPDMTIPVARLVGVRLHDWPMPQRFCYAGSVFRYTAPQAGRQREFWQAGVELIGAGSPEADAEVIALTVHAVRAAGIEAFRLVLGQIQYFDGLLQDLHLEDHQAAALQHAIDRNSAEQLDDFLRSVPLRTQQRHAVEGLPRLSGRDAHALLDQAGRLCLNYTMHRALENLRAIYTGLVAFGVADFVHLDLTEIHNLGYYTGVTFEVITPELGFPIGSGGRYDHLLATFGPAQPAVGVALGIDRMLAAQELQGQTRRVARPVAPDLLVATGGSAEALAVVAAWRAAGLRVALSLDGAEGDALGQAARRHGARFALSWTGAGFAVLDTAAPEPAAAEFLPAAGYQRIITACRPAPDPGPVS